MNFDVKNGERWTKLDENGLPETPWTVVGIIGFNGEKMTSLSLLHDLPPSEWDDGDAVGSVIRETRIGLSGPGPCRAYQSITLKELFTAWRKVVAEVIPIEGERS